MTSINQVSCQLTGPGPRVQSGDSLALRSLPSAQMCVSVRGENTRSQNAYISGQESDFTLHTSDVMCISNLEPQFEGREIVCQGEPYGLYVHNNIPLSLPLTSKALG